MLFFHAFLKRKAVKRTLLHTDNIFSPQIKKHRTQIKTLWISNESRIKVGISVNFLKNKHFFTLQNNDFFYFNLQFWRSATLLIRTLYILFQIAFCNQLTIIFAPLKAISTFKRYCTPYELLVSVLWLTLSFDEASKTYRRMH